MSFLGDLASPSPLRRAWEAVVAKRGVPGIDRVRPGRRPPLPARPRAGRIHPARSATSLWGADLFALPADLTPDLLGLAPEPFVAPRPVAIDLLSPTHLLSRGKPLPRNEPIPFEVLIKSTLDRFAGLYGGSACPVLAHEIRTSIETAAAEVPLLDQNLRGAEASHYSRRSRAHLDLGGVVGRLVYGPQAAAFIHILRAAEILHLGKNPTFGCGRLRLDLLS